MSRYCFQVSREHAGLRLDVFLSQRQLGLSRNQVQRLLTDNYIQVCGRRQKASYRLRIGEQVTLIVPPSPPPEVAPEPIKLDILFEDDFIIAVNKPAALVVHPAAGHRQGTLVQGLLHHCGRLADLGGPLRPGIVHRLDKNTSGVLVAAKNDVAYRHLSSQFKQRRVHKEYLALVYGRLAGLTGQIDAPIRRDPKHRKRMSVAAEGRQAHTWWRCQRAFAELSLLEVVTKTGRTHQIRVHLAHIDHPLVGDTTYGGRRRARFLQNPVVRAYLLRLKRQMLHARRLVLEHPASRKSVELEAPLPDDMGSLLHFLRQYGS